MSSADRETAWNDEGSRWKLVVEASQGGPGKVVHGLQSGLQFSTVP